MNAIRGESSHRFETLSLPRPGAKGFPGYLSAAEAQAKVQSPRGVTLEIFFFFFCPIIAAALGRPAGGGLDYVLI